MSIPSATPSPTGGSPTLGGTPASDPTVPLPPKPTAPPKSPTDPRPGEPVRTIRGTVSAGVEPNCVLLDGYLLVGGPRETLRPGARVVVSGRVQADLITTCQQGIPFLVTEAKPS